MSYTYDGERDIKSATRCLFDALRTFDDQNVDTIYAEGFAEPAAAGYMDRLRRAASGSNNEEPVDPPRQILFICTGNTCRSPMAEVLFNHRNVKGWKAVSAGLAAYPGMSISPRSAEALREWGIDVDAHRSQSVDDDLMEATDLIVTMTDAHAISYAPLSEKKRRHLFYSAFTEDQRTSMIPMVSPLTPIARRVIAFKGLETPLAELERRS